MQKNVYTVAMLDGDELTVQALLCDQVRAEQQLRQRNANVESAPVTFVSAIAWAALAREGRTDLKFDEFTKAAIDVSRDEEKGDGEDLDPTQASPSTGSA